MEGQVKLRDGKKVGARGGRGAGAGRGGRLRSLCPRSGRLGGWCCASRRRWQVSGRGARGAGGRAGGGRRGLRSPGRPERGQLARNSRRRRPGGNRRAESAASACSCREPPAPRHRCRDPPAPPPSPEGRLRPEGREGQRGGVGGGVGVRSSSAAVLFPLPQQAAGAPREVPPLCAWGD